MRIGIDSAKTILALHCVDGRNCVWRRSIRCGPMMTVYEKRRILAPLRREVVPPVGATLVIFRVRRLPGPLSAHQD